MDQSLVTDYLTNGFAIAKTLFSAEECAYYADYFTSMVERGGEGWAEGGVDPNHADPLKRYPRLLQPHRGDDIAFNFMIDPRVNQHLTAFCGEEPLAVQTMVYFKPPGARGQNLHQDNTYLRVNPGTCIAAWLALDDCDEENGCMMLVPQSQAYPELCQNQVEGLAEICWGDWETPIPEGLRLVPAHMKRGDVLFFGGQVIHGSYRNNSDRFRRTLIGHYIAAETTQVAKYYFPVFRMDGSRLEDGDLKVSEEGGPCGRLVETESGQRVKLDGQVAVTYAAH
jgi:phytanoyl-CoA hydroxylase